MLNVECLNFGFFVVVCCCCLKLDSISSMSNLISSSANSVFIPAFTSTNQNYMLIYSNRSPIVTIFITTISSLANATANNVPAVGGSVSLDLRNSASINITSVSMDGTSSVSYTITVVQMGMSYLLIFICFDLS